MYFLSKAEDPRHIWRPSCNKASMTTREQALIDDSKDWIEHEIDGDNLIEQALLGHCVVVDVNNFSVIPESEWIENVVVESGE